MPNPSEFSDITFNNKLQNMALESADIKGFTRKSSVSNGGTYTYNYLLHFISKKFLDFNILIIYLTKNIFS